MSRSFQRDNLPFLYPCPWQRRSHCRKAAVEMENMLRNSAINMGIRRLYTHRPSKENLCGKDPRGVNGTKNVPDASLEQARRNLERAHLKFHYSSAIDLLKVCCIIDTQDKNSVLQSSEKRTIHSKCLNT